MYDFTSKYQSIRVILQQSESVPNIHFELSQVTDEFYHRKRYPVHFIKVRVSFWHRLV